MVARQLLAQVVTSALPGLPGQKNDHFTAQCRFPPGENVHKVDYETRVMDDDGACQ